MPPSEGRGRRIGALLLGVGVSLGLLWWAARGVDFADLVEHIRRADVGLLLLAVGVATACFGVRALRWRDLLLDERGRPLGLGPLWHATAAGFMGNNLLPFRAGELLRAVVAAKLGPARLPSVIASIGMERVFDGLTVVGLLAVGLVAADLPRDLTIAGVSVARAASVAGLLSVAAFGAAVVLVTAPGWSSRLAARLLPAAFAARVATLVEGLAAGASAVRSPARLARIAGWSVVHWLMNALAFWLAARAFGLGLSVPATLLMQGVLVFGIAVPSTPGFIGPFEAVIVAVLAVFAIPQDVAFSYAITYHLSTFLPITLLGLWSLSKASLSLSGAASATVAA